MKKGLILMANGVEECEALMVVDCVRRASMEIDMVSINQSIMVNSAHNIEFKCDKLLSEIDIENYDYLVIPGGKLGVDNLAASELVTNVINTFVNANKLIAAICAGPSVITRLGYLDGKKYTVYPGFEVYSDKAIFINESCVVDQNFITANGLGAEFVFVQAILTAIANEKVATQVLDSIQYRGL